MVSDLVSSRRDRAHEMRVGVGSVPGDEECCRNRFSLEQLQNPLATDGAELATRDHAGRLRREGTEPERDGVEVEGQANGGFRQVRCHGSYRA